MVQNDKSWKDIKPLGIIYGTKPDEQGFESKRLPDKYVKGFYYIDFDVVIGGVNMAHAELCPVCAGRGQVFTMNPLYTGDTQVCHGCGGTGWVTVQDPPPLIPTVKGETITSEGDMTHIDRVRVRLKDEGDV
jgi:hypothetical protein